MGGEEGPPRSSQPESPGPKGGLSRSSRCGHEKAGGRHPDRQTTGTSLSRVSRGQPLRTSAQSCRDLARSARRSGLERVRTRQHARKEARSDDPRLTAVRQHTSSVKDRGGPDGRGAGVPDIPPKHRVTVGSRYQKEGARDGQRPVSPAGPQREPAAAARSSTARPAHVGRPGRSRPGPAVRGVSPNRVRDPTQWQVKEPHRRVGRATAAGTE